MQPFSHARTTLLPLAAHDSRPHARERVPAHPRILGDDARRAANRRNGGGGCAATRRIDNLHPGPGGRARSARPQAPFLRMLQRLEEGVRPPAWRLIGLLICVDVDTTADLNKGRLT